MTDSMKIVTNNVPRQIIGGYQLTEKEKADFDYVDINEIDARDFVRYKGNLYDMGDMMRVSENEMSDLYSKGWHAHESDTFFSGVLFKFTEDHESVICASYFCR